MFPVVSCVPTMGFSCELRSLAGFGNDDYLAVNKMKQYCTACSVGKVVSTVMFD